MKAFKGNSVCSCLYRSSLLGFHTVRLLINGEHVHARHWLCVSYGYGCQSVFSQHEGLIVDG